MFIRASNRRRLGFTLLEVLIATLIISLLAFTLFRFVSTHLLAMQTMTEIGAERETVQAVVRLIETQLADLPRRQNGVILGNPLKVHDLPSDELIWRARAGQGVLSAAAPGEYRVTLTVQPVEGVGNEYELGIRREPVTTEARNNLDFFGRGSGQSKYNWVSLIRPMEGFEVRYFDPRLNAWLDRWTDQTARPSLVKVRLWRRASEPPVEAIIAVPSGRISQP